jgi:NlpC/P60 family putative phage cell wall peptidase
MPAYTRDWGDVTGSEPLLAAARRNLVPVAVELARPSDILVFRMQVGVAKHAGIVTEEVDEQPARFIRAVEELGVTEVALTRWWRRRIEAAFSFPGVK